MQNKGVFILLRDEIRFKGTKRQGQIATFIVLFVAVMALLAAIVINISRVAYKRASVANAAVGATLQLASTLGSYARMLSCKYLSCKAKKCKTSWLSVAMVAVVVVGAVVGGLMAFTALAAASVSAGASIGTLGGLAFVAMGAIGGALVAGVLSGAFLKFFYQDPKMLSAMNSAFNKMKPKDSMAEQAIQYAFMNTVDDQQKVADMHDLDMDEKWGLDTNNEPYDVINRFFYKYTQRAMWLSSSGPAPDGSSSTYEDMLDDLIGAFIPSLDTFNKSSESLSKYIGKIPTEKKPQAEAPDFWQPDYIDSLYTLFAYLQEREYKDGYVDKQNKYADLITEPELYYLSHHTNNEFKLINVWTRGVKECPAEDSESEEEGPEDETEENYDLDCYHASVNDEMDSLANDLYNFSYNPYAPGCPPQLSEDTESEDSESEDSEFTEYESLYYPDTEFVGFAPTLLCTSTEDRNLTFEEWWYDELYSTCDEYNEEEMPPPNPQPCDDPDYCGDEGNDCQYAYKDFSDYYDQIWEVPDDPNTEYVIEKGWNQTITDWLSRIDAIKNDIELRIEKLEDLLEEKQECCQRMMERECCDEIEKIEKEIERLKKLLEKVDEARNNLIAFQGEISSFRTAIETLRDGYNQLEDDPFSDSSIDDYKLYSKRSPEYVWYDSLGRHSVKVEVKKFKLAKLKAYKKGCCTYCVKLKNKSGKPKITVTRKDDPTTATLPQGKLLWQFTYPEISYKAKAKYKYKGKPPTLQEVTRVK